MTQSSDMQSGDLMTFWDWTANEARQISFQDFLNQVATQINYSVLSGYMVYHVLLTQAGTAAPTVTVLLNRLGFTPSITRTGVGTYLVTTTNHGFTSGKTACFIQDAGPNGMYFNDVRYTNDNTITITTGYLNVNNTPVSHLEAVAADGVLSNTFLVLRVYV